MSGLGAKINRLAPPVLGRVLGPPLRVLGEGDASFLARLTQSYPDALLALDNSNWRSFINAHGLAGRASVLDVGCGPGAWLPELARVNTQVVAIDVSEQLLEIARHRTQGLPNIEIRRASAERLDFKDGSFDAAACLTVLPYLDAPAAVRELVRVLRPGGTLVLGTVGAGYYAKHIVEGIRHGCDDAIRYGLDPLMSAIAWRLSRGRRATGSLRCWSAGGVCRALERGGFEIERVTTETTPVDPSWPSRYLLTRVYFTVTARRRACVGS